MRCLVLSATALAGCLAVGLPPVRADVLISVDKSTQRMSVFVDGAQRYSWPVSTGMAGYLTPAGSFTPSRLLKQHYSREWDSAPMPHSIFFTEAGHAIHGSNATARLGTPASHGCIRLAPGKAAILFDLVSTEGVGNTRIEVTGTDAIATALTGGSGMGRDYSHITSFDPLSTGIMAGGGWARQRPDRSR
jgi:hypothetical protein